jgi:putative transcriptional regulator
METQRHYYFRLKIKELVQERGITQGDLARATGIRAATISEMAHNSRTVINKTHLAKIMDALDLTQLDEILVLEIEETF